MSKVLNQIFEDYNKSRIQFTQNIHDYCMKSYNIELLINTDIIIFLRPLILDKVPIVQQNATLILAKLASHSEDAALTIIQNDILPHLIFCLKHENKNYRRNCAYTIKCIARHNSKLANIVTENNKCIEYLIDCLDEYDLKLKESCISSLCAIVKNDVELSRNIVNKGIIPLLILNLQEKEKTLIKCCIHLLAELSKECTEIAKTIVDSNALPLLIKHLDSNDVNIKRHTCNCLAHIAKHEEELTELLIEHDIFPKILYLLKDNDDIVKKNCAICLKEMSKHNGDIGKIIVKSGALNFLCEFIEQNNDSIKLPAILSIGFIASFSETLSLNIILTNAISIFKKCLIEESEDYVKSACVWALGNIGKHSPEHTNKICDENILSIFVNLYNSNDSSDDLKKKIKISLKNIVFMLTDLDVLETVLLKCPINLAKYMIQQCSKLLPNNPAHRKSFIKSGCLQRVQEIKNSEEGKKMEAEINSINQSFPEDIINFYTPGYSETLIKRIDDEGEK